MLRKKQIGTICFIFSILIFPSYATINVQPGSTAVCNSSTLTTSDDNVTANLTAQYHANTISVTYDANGGTTSNGGTWTNNGATQCTYDLNFNLPTAPSKTGYNFDGWKVKTPETECYASSVCGINSSTFCGLYRADFGFKGSTNEENAGTYGLTEPQTWAVEFTNGAIARGEASCNNTSSVLPLCTDDALDALDQQLMTAVDNGEMTEEEADAVWNEREAQCSSQESCVVANRFNRTSTGQYCWCKMTSYTPSGGSTCNVTTPHWVKSHSSFNTASCATNCAFSCAANFRNYTNYSHALFGISGQCEEPEPQY